MKILIALVKRLMELLSIGLGREAAASKPLLIATPFDNRKTVAKCLVALCCVPLLAQAEIFSARVIAVLDGDTVLVLRGCERVEPEAPGTPRRPPCGGNQKIKVRLANIDAPEVGHAGMGGMPPNSQKDQAYGQQSRASLLEMVGNKQVEIGSQAVDQYGRTVGQISVAGLNVNQEQVKRGMAWEYSHYHSDKTYIALQSDAQQARRGLWSQANPQAPWQWRSRHVTGEASRLREQPPAARFAGEGLPQADLGRRKLHPSVKPEMANQIAVARHGSKTQWYDMECGKKHHCAQINSCDEAHFYLTRCGVKTLDGNKDGVPCEQLCGDKP